MKITFLAHSGFCVQLDNITLIFDYFEGDIPALEPETHIYVFSSHQHFDHFNFDIFKLAQKYTNIDFILSDDIGEKYSQKYIMQETNITEDIYSKITYMVAEEYLKFADISVDTLVSTDLGVAFIVSAAGKRIYHAGDLNWWTWEGETPEQYKNRTNNFKNALLPLKDQHLDVAFLPIDGRQKDRFYLGFDYFMRNVDVDHVFPMHFWNNFSIAGQLKGMDVSMPYRNKIIDIHENGQAFIL